MHSIAWPRLKIIVFAVLQILFCLNIPVFSQEIAGTIIDNMMEGEKQSVLYGRIDTLSITRGPISYYFGAGDVTLFDFGSGRPLAMVYRGSGKIVYNPPDKVETYQMRKFTEADTLNGSFINATLVFSIDLASIIDTSKFSRGTVSKDAWGIFSNTLKDSYANLGQYLPNCVMGDALSGQPGFFLLADCEVLKFGHLLFIEDPSNDDLYTLCKLRRTAGAKTADILGACSPDSLLPSQRGVNAIDISSYNIDSRIEGGGKMISNCWIKFTPLRMGIRALHFYWYDKNKILSVTDSDGNSLFWFCSKDESGFGLVLSKPAELGKIDSIFINYECKSLENIWGVFYCKSGSGWYPGNPFRDCATFDMTFNSPEHYQVVACGDNTSTIIQDGRAISKWLVTKPVEYVSFNIGNFDSKMITVPNLPPVKVYISNNIPHTELALYLAEKEGILSSADMIGRVGADVTNSMAFFTSLFGPCPFDTIKATEIPINMGQGSPGLIYLSWSTYQTEGLEGQDVQFRAHEVAHQWWGHVVDKEIDRDTWITEGLAQYCGFWFYQLSEKKTNACNNILNSWRQDIMTGTGVNSVGSKAGPVVLGARLASSKSDDYQNLVYNKGAYIFHMIRYLMHDYKTGSDDAFANFLKDLAVKYKDKIITTPLLQKLLEDHIGSDMTWFFNQWVYGTEIPKYKYDYTSVKTPENKYKVGLNVIQKNVSDGFAMIVPITVLFDDDRYIHLKIMVDKPEAEIELPILPLKPKKIIFNTFSAVLCEVD